MTTNLPGGLTVAKWLEIVGLERGPGYVEACTEALAYYLGNARQFVQSSLTEKFPETAKHMVPVALGLVPTVIDTRARVFVGRDDGERFDLEGAERNAPGAADDAEQQAWEAICADASLSSRLLDADRMTELLNRCFVRVTFDVRADALRLTIFPPQLVAPRFGCDSWSLDDAEGALLTLAPVHDASGKVIKRYEFWSAGDDKTPPQNFIIDERGVVLAAGERGDGANPYSDDDGAPIVPLVSFGATNIDAGYWRAPRTQLIDAQKAINTHVTSLLHLATVSGYGQPVFEKSNAQDGGTLVPVSSRDGGSEGIVVFGPDTPVVMNPGWSFTSVPAVAQFNDLLRVLSEIVKTACLFERIPPSAVTAETRQVSGYALTVENAPLRELRAERIEQHRASVQRLLDVMRWVWNAHHPGAEIARRAKWTPGDLHPPTDPEQQARVDEISIRNGVSSPVRILMRDEGMTRADAQVRAAEIAEENAARNQMSGLGRLLMGGAAEDREDDKTDDADPAQE